MCHTKHFEHHEEKLKPFAKINDIFEISKDVFNGFGLAKEKHHQPFQGGLITDKNID